MRKDVTIALVLWIVGIVSGWMLGMNHMKVKSERDKIKIYEQVRAQEHEHQKRENDIIKEFKESERNLKETIRDINDSYSDSLREHEERAEYYRQEYQQCSDRRIVDRTISLDRHLQEGVSLVEELEAIIEHKESVIESLRNVILNDRLLINSH